MEGIEQFAAVLRARFGTEDFTAHDVMVELVPAQLPPATRACARQRGMMTSIAKHVAQIPGVRRDVRRGYRTMWRLP